MRSLALLAALTLTACKDDGPIGETGDPVGAVDEDGDGYTAEQGDCDDNDPFLNPGAEEVCDSVDNNCDGSVDEGVTTTFYADADADGYGDDAATTVACGLPEGHAAVGGDCDDSDPAYNPGAAEDDCTDPNDYNCDGSVGYADNDADGFPACQECDDTDAAVNPDATEVCDGLDNDCDGAVDDADDSLDASTASTWYGDYDADGYGDDSLAQLACEQPGTSSAVGGDCDDGDADVNPAAQEVCNSVDDDCDGLIDDADDSVDLSTGAAYYADADGDGYGDAATSTQSCEAGSGYVADSSDCDDGDGAIHPAAQEVCDGVDNDCDGLSDDNDGDVDTSTGATFYADADADGYGDASASVEACSAPTAYVSDATDCDDGVATTYPGAPELCDAVDNDCDGAADDGVLGSAATCSAADCAEVLADQPSAADGLYWVYGATNGDFEAWCDMTTDGGGWTLIGSVVNEYLVTGSHSRSWNSLTVWTDTTTFGNYASSDTADFKGEGFVDTTGDDLLFVTDQYAFGFYNVLGGASLATFITGEYDSNQCSQGFLASGADYYDQLTATQAAALSFVVRPKDTNATCFPGSNENSIIGTHLASCCWAGGPGNCPTCQGYWQTHDLGMLSLSNVIPETCTAGVYPCNDNGYTLSQGGFSYDTAKKAVFAEMYVR
ncbi:MAG: hypothetical protein H6741_26955 [Alphaproteobacteria bacterium]|nr:hypothetical protein [Alphaproteobacteria bacterium]MCB9796351.1 hypothetical protein [Alphaproteobacteria bacterium]